MDIAWTTFFKIAVTWGGIYVFTPIFLILRDMLIWGIITKFILTVKFRSKITQYVHLVHRNNTEFSVPHGHKGNAYFVGDKEVTEQEYNEYYEKERLLKNMIDNINLSIKFRSRLIDLCLSQFKHQGINPIQDWLDSEYSRISNKKTVEAPVPPKTEAI